MKKLLLSSLVATSIFAFAYTTTDVSNASFLANQGIIVKQSIESNYRLDNTITRAEAIGIALKIKGVTLPESYTCKKYFSDTTTNDWKCRAIELAADNGIITRNNTKARPNDTITRAEALAIVMKAGGVTKDVIPEGTEGIFFDVNNVRWQSEILNMAHFAGVLDISSMSFLEKGSPQIHIYREYRFYPDRAATRAEVFGFAKNILTYKATISGEVTTQ